MIREPPWEPQPSATGLDLEHDELFQSDDPELAAEANDEGKIPPILLE